MQLHAISEEFIRGILTKKIEHSNMPLTTNSMVVILVQNSTDYNNNINCMAQCSSIAQYIFSLEGIIIILHMSCLPLPDNYSFHIRNAGYCTGDG